MAPLTFAYKNHRGEVANRSVTPISVRWGTTPWHPTPCWLLLAFDHERGAQREFNMADMLGPVEIRTDLTFNPGRGGRIVPGE